jgi:superfamily II DNA/RNA helicase
LAVGETSQLSAQKASKVYMLAQRCVEKTRYFLIGTLPALSAARTQSRVSRKGVSTMFAIFAPGRETATAFAAAFITAMLFVSSATSVLPIA